MKKNKTLLLLGLLFTTLFLLLGCQSKTKKYTINYLLEDVNQIGSYQEFFKEESVDINVNKLDELAQEKVNELNLSKNYVYKKIAKEENQIKLFFDLKEFDIKIRYQNPEITLNQKVKYLQLVDFSKVKEEINQILIYDINNLRFITEKTLVDDNLELLITSRESQSKLATLLVQCNEILEELTYDAIIKEASEYGENLKVVLRSSYEEFKLATMTAAKEIVKTNSDLYESYANLKIAYDKVMKEYVVGTNPDITYQASTEQVANQLKLEIEEKTAHLSKFLFFESPLAANQYYNYQQVIKQSLYFEYDGEIKNARTVLAQVDYTLSDLELFKVRAKLDMAIARLEALYQKVESEKIIGTKNDQEATYQVLTYYQNEDKTYKAPVITTVNARLNDIIKYEPQVVEGYVINSEKTIINGVIKDNNLKLKVYYDIQEVMVMLDLDGGKINAFNQNYINLLYGKAISADVVNKLKTVTKESDKYASSYTFIKFINYGNGEEFDFSTPIKSDITLQAVYESVATSYKYQVKIFIDEPLTFSMNIKLAIDKQIEPSYSTIPNEVLEGAELAGGTFLQYPYEVPEGFEIDKKLSILQYNKVGVGDDILIYLKRKLVKVTFDFDGGQLKGYGTKEGINPRIVNDAVILKYGQKLDIMLSGLVKPKTSDGKYQIFKQANIYNPDTNQYEQFDFNSEITQNLHLEVEYKEVPKIIHLEVYKSYKGLIVPIDSGSVVEHRYNIYLEPGQKISDLAVFHPDSFVRATFDPENDKGIMMLGTQVITKDHVFEMSGTETEEKQTLYLLNHYTFNQTIDVLYNDQWKSSSGGNVDFSRTFTATIVGKITDKLYVLEDSNQSRALFVIEKQALTNEEKEIIKVGNEISFSGSATFAYRKNSPYYPNFYELVTKYKNYSTVKLISTKPVVEATNTDTFLVDSLYKYNFSKLLLLEKPSLEGSYYKAKVSNPKGELSYLYMPTSSVGFKKFLELRKDDLIDINDGVVIKTRTLRTNNDQSEFPDQRLHPRNGIYVSDYNNHINYLEKELVSVKVNFEFSEYQNYVTHENFQINVTNYKSNHLVSVINQIKDEYFFNGYKLTNVLIDDQAIDLDNYVLNNNLEITLDYQKDDQVIEVYVGSYLPGNAMLHKSILKFSYGGRAVETAAVDHDGYFAKYIISYLQSEEWIRCSHILAETDEFEFGIVVPLEKRLEKAEIKAVIFDAMSYSQHNADYNGEEEKPEYSLGWEGKPAWMFYENERLILMQIMTDNLIDIGTSLEDGVRFISKNNINADGEFSLNRDFNVYKDGYANFESNYAIRVGIKDQALTDEEVKNNEDFYVGVAEKFPVYEWQGDRYIVVGEKTVPYHKDSLTKIANFNKFGIYQVGLRIGKKAFLSKPGVSLHDNLYIVDDFEILENSIDNESLIHTPEKYLEVAKTLEKSEQYQLRHKVLYKPLANLSYSIIGDSHLVFEHNRNNYFSIPNVKYMDKIDPTKLKVFGFDPNKHLAWYYINDSKVDDLDYYYNFNETRNEILIFNKQKIKFRVLNSYAEFDNLKLGYGYNSTDYQLISGVQKDGFMEFEVELFRTNHSRGKVLVNNIIFVRDDENLNGVEPQLKIDATQVDALKNNNYIYIQGGNQPITRFDDSRLFVFAHDEQLAGHAASDLKLVIKNHTKGTIETLDSNVDIVTKGAFFNYRASLQELDNQLEIYLADKNLKRLNEINLKDLIDPTRVKVVELRVDNVSSVSDDVIDKTANYLDVHISTNRDDITLPFNQIKIASGSPQQPSKFDISKLNLPTIPGYELMWGVKDQNGSYMRVDMNRGIAQKTGYIDLKAFYMPINKPGEYVRVEFVFDENINRGELGAQTLNNAILVKADQMLEIPQILEVISSVSSYREFDGYYIGQNKLDINSFTVGNGDRNITINVKSKLIDGKVLYRYTEYFSDHTGFYSQTLDKFISADQGVNIEYLLDDLNIHNGFEVNTEKSTLEGTATNTLHIEVYYKVKEYEVRLHLEGGVMNPRYQGYLEFDEDLGYVHFYIKYGQLFRINEPHMKGLDSIFNDTRGYPIKEDYKFNKNARYEYYLDGELTIIETRLMPQFLVESDIDIYIVYVKEKTDEYSYTFNYYLEDKDNTDSYPADPTTDNLTAIWDDHVDKSNFHPGYEPDEAHAVTNQLSETITDNGVVLTGHFKRKTFEVTFDLHSGTWEGLVETQHIRYENLLKLPEGTPTVEGANFEHFMVNGQVVSDLSTLEVKKDLLIEAVYDKAEYKVEIYKENADNQFELFETKTIFADLNLEVTYNDKLDGFTLLTNYKDTKLSGKVGQGLVLKAYYMIMIRPSEFDLESSMPPSTLSIPSNNILGGLLKIGPSQNTNKEVR